MVRVIPFQWSARLKCIYRFYILAPKLKCMVSINNKYLYLIYYYYILNFLIQIYLGAEFLSQGLKWTRASTIEKRLYVGLDSHWRNLWFIIQRVVMSCAEVNFRVWAACIKRFVSQWRLGSIQFNFVGSYKVDPTCVQYFLIFN